MSADAVAFKALEPGTQPPNDSPTYGSTHLRHPARPPLRIPSTITETTGPVLSPAHFPPMPDLSMVKGQPALGERIIVRGRVVDENDRPIPNTIIEIWQANAAGRYDH